MVVVVTIREGAPSPGTATEVALSLVITMVVVVTIREGGPSPGTTMVEEVPVPADITTTAVLVRATAAGAIRSIAVTGAEADPTK